MSVATEYFPDDWATPAQRIVFNSPARFRMLIAGRRFGKTTLAINEIIRGVQERPRQKVWYLAPTYRMAKRIAWKSLKEAIPASWIARKDETELLFDLRYCESQIALHGTEDPDRLRGEGVHLAIFDEAADMDPDVWYEVVRPALADTRGAALFIGTPKGYNWVYDLFVDAQTQPDWQAWQFTTIQGGNVPPEEVELAKATLSPKQFAQEFEASFEELANRVYSNFSRRETVAEVSDNGGSVLIGMDFNVDPMSACVGSRVADQLHVWDEIVIPNGNTEEMAQEIKRRFPGRDIQVYPDPSGNARKTSAPVGQTDFTILRGYGFKVIAPKAAPLVADRINEVQALLLSATGQRRFYIHPRCKHLIRSLEGLTYKEGTSQPMKNGLDHMADACAYLIHSEFPIIKRPSFATKTAVGLY